MFPGSGGANEVKILLTAVDKASPAFDKVQAELKQTEKQTGGMGGAFKAAHTNMLGMVAGGTAVLGTVVGIGMAIKRTADEYMNYAMEVGNLQRILGASVEETSRLIQLADDYAISTGQLEAALKAAIRQGYEPTIESMGKMSDEYLTLDAGAERTKFLMDTFGRSGADLARIMELGSQKIQEMGHSIDGTSLLMTDEGMQAAKEYEQSLDLLGDTILVVKYNLAQELIPAIVDYVEFAENNLRVTLELNKTEEMLGFIWKKNFFAAKKLHDEMRFGKMANEEYEARLYELWAQTQDYIVVSSSLRNELNLTQWSMRDLGAAVEDTGNKLGESTQKAFIMAGGIEEIGAKAGVAAGGMDELASATTDWTTRIDTGISSAIQNAIKQMDFLQAGGMTLVDTNQAIWDALADKKITPAQAEEMFKQLYVAAQALETDINSIEYRDALQNIRDTLGLGFGEAKKTLEEIWSRKGQTMDMKVFIQFIADINKEIRAGGGGGKAPPRNPPRPIPPEDWMEVIPGGGNNGMNINEINVFGGGDPGAIANQVVNQLNLLQRGAYRAGIEYTGR